MSSTSDLVGSTATSLRKGYTRRDRESSGHVCTACDQCYRCKVKCTGERPACQRCQNGGSACTYSTGKPLGKPKGSKNKVQRTMTRQEPGAPRSTTPLSPPTKKRPNDGTLPPSKRVLATSSTGHELSAHLPFKSPKFNSPEVSSAITTSKDHHESNCTLGIEPTVGYSSLVRQDEHLNHILEQPTPTDMNNIFPSAGLNLEMDDFHWFTQSESYISATPSGAANNCSAHTESPSGISSHTSSHQTNFMTQLSHSRPLDRNPQYPQCLCDPLSLGIISELYTLQLSYSPLDTALLMARRGLSTVSSYLACPSCLHHLSSSPSLFLACVLILQQVFTCYVTLRIHGTSMLSVLSKHKDREDSPRVAIGEFEVEGEESCNVLLDVIVRAEMEKGKGVIGGLEQWMEKVGDGKYNVVGVLLQSLREEIGGGY